MAINRKPRFSDCLDTIQVVAKPAKEGLGEDSFYCSKGRKSSIISVYDGCGGLGSKKYESFGGHSGAYIASRTVSGAVRDWYHANYWKNWKDVKKLSESVNRFISKGYDVCKPYLSGGMKIRGSMVRELPTTMALAYAECEEGDILLHLLWAGDSRVYLLNAQGLAQLTLDDAYVEDALENLRNDSPMTNVLSSDGKYVINTRTLVINEPAIVFAATDGCFAYLPTPMDFEYLLLQAVADSGTPEAFCRTLRSRFSKYAGDDFSFGMMSFFYGDYLGMQESLNQRRAFLEINYIQKMQADSSVECENQLWAEYKTGYERYMRD